MVDAVRTNPPPDPEFETARIGPLDGDLGAEPEKFLRMLANPFLSFFYLVLWFGAMYESVAGGFAGPLMPMLIVVLIAALGLVPTLAQYHCLDCGATGRLLRWRRHSCQKSIERKITGRSRSMVLPNPPLQIVLWIWIVMTAALLLNAAKSP